MKGVYFTIQRLLPLFNEHGSIILNSSATVHQTLPNTSVYMATKVAVVLLARTFLLELLDRNIRVNTISPGPIATPINQKMFDRLSTSAEAAT